MLKPLATAGVGQKQQVDINYLVEHPDEIVPYFTSNAADDVLLTIGSMLAQNGEKVDVQHLTNAQQQQLKTAMDNGQLSTWVAKKYRNGRSDPDEVSRNVLADTTTGTDWSTSFLFGTCQCLSVVADEVAPFVQVKRSLISSCCSSAGSTVLPAVKLVLGLHRGASAEAVAAGEQLPESPLVCRASCQRVCTPTNTCLIACSL